MGISENDIRLEVTTYLKCKGWFTFHNYQQGYKCYAGVSDYTAIRGGVTLWIETKTLTGKQSDSQIQFQADVEAAGGYYIIARSWVDVEDYLKERGIKC